MTVSLPASEAERIATAYCSRYGYGPIDFEDAMRFVKDHIFDQLRIITLQYEADIAAQAARDAVYTNPDDPLASAQVV